MLQTSRKSSSKPPPGTTPTSQDSAPCLTASQSFVGASTKKSPDLKAPNSSSSFLPTTTSLPALKTLAPSTTNMAESGLSLIPAMSDLTVNPSTRIDSDTPSTKLHSLRSSLASPSPSLGLSLGPSRPASPVKSEIEVDNRAPLSHSQSSKHTLFSVPTSFSSSTSNSSCMSLARIDKEYLILILKLPLAQIKSEILRLSKDQYGCRFLQKKLDELVVPQSAVRRQNFDIIFAQVSPFSYELIIDPFGNYLVQKLIQYCSEANLDAMLEILLPNLFQISINQHGTRALQKMIECLTNSHQLDLLISGLQPYIIELIKDLNGNHVIQRLLFKYSPQNCQFIYESIIENMLVVATHKHGCCVLQKCLKHVTPSQLNAFSDAILELTNFTYLVNDQFGNYVLQYLISLDSWKINHTMFQNFCNYGIQSVCTSKFSSNVAEKFLKNAYHNEARGMEFSNLKFDLIYWVLSCDLNLLVNDPYGNYVVQTSIDVLNNPDSEYYTMIDHDTTTVSLKAEKLALLVPILAMDLVEGEGLEVIVIKRWFQTCTITSTYGKRIQSKINSLVYSHAIKPAAYETGLLRMASNKGFRSMDFQRGHSHSQSGASIGSYNSLYSNKPYTYGNGMGSHVKGGSYGDFVVNENYTVASQHPHGAQALYHPSRRSASMSSTQSEVSRYSLGLLPGNGSYLPFHQQSDSASSTNTSLCGPGGASEFVYGTPHLRSDSGDFEGNKGAFTYGTNLAPPYSHQRQHSKPHMSLVLKNGLVSPEAAYRAAQCHTPHMGGSYNVNHPVNHGGLDYGLPLEASPICFGTSPARHSRNTSAHNFVGNYPQSFSTPVAEGADHGRLESQHALHTPLPLQLHQLQQHHPNQHHSHYLWNSPALPIHSQKSTPNHSHTMLANIPLEQSFLQEDCFELKNIPEHHQKTAPRSENLAHEATVSPIKF